MTETALLIDMHESVATFLDYSMKTSIMKKNIIIIGTLMIAIVGVVQLKKQKTPSTSHSTEISAPLPKLLELGSIQCVPCKMMEPILDEMRETFADQLHVEFIDVWENRDAAKQHKIRMIPTQIFFDGKGNELFRHEGFFAQEDILAKWQELGYVLLEDK